ncbi:MAG: hypothetical protein HC794_06840, partial [Nitrospiraceae bacterium]|nr:hypothetical protein [Nitrospiraceae bacterium]
GQVATCSVEIRARVERHERVLVTTLTKRMAEDLTEYYAEIGIRCRYLHSDIDTLERVQILRELRLGEFDVLIGINLLREGLDLPEVSLVAILDADKEGFLRSERSLIQTMGRAARHIHGAAILYADAETDSMKYAISETSRRKKIQEEHNRIHGVTPESIAATLRTKQQEIQQIQNEINLINQQYALLSSQLVHQAMNQKLVDWFSKIASDFPQSDLKPKALGAKRRASADRRRRPCPQAARVQKNARSRRSARSRTCRSC